MRNSVTAHILYAFEKDGQGGNPAAVVLDADRLTREQKQAVAREMGLSETAFVSRSPVAEFKLEFFTPTRQIAHCGHATIAAFSYLRQAGRIGEGASSKQTIDGRRTILIEGDVAFMEQRPPEYFVPHEVDAAADVESLARSLGIPHSALDERHPPVVCSTGNRFVLIALRDRHELAALAPRMEAIDTISSALDAVGYYVWATGTGDCLATARMFAPRYGIREEAGTGMAAGPLAAYLSDRGLATARAIQIEQGAFMQPPSPSLITVRIERTSEGVRGLFVGGRARYAGIREIQRM